MSIGVLGTRGWVVPAALAALLLACGEEPEVVAVEESQIEAAPLETPLLKRYEEIPEQFPDDVTPYAEADLLGVVEESGKLFVQMSTDDDYETVMDFYESSFAAEGWSTRRVYDPDGEGLGGAIFGEKEGRAATVFITATDAGSLVDIFIEPEVE